MQPEQQPNQQNASPIRQIGDAFYYGCPIKSDLSLFTMRFFATMCTNGVYYTHWRL